jgi:hypothetical protein
MKNMKYSGEKASSGWIDNPVFAKSLDLACNKAAQDVADAIDAGALSGGEVEIAEAVEYIRRPLC